MADEAPSIQQRILEAARSLFLTKGYNGSNLRDIAREAQVSMGGIYHHFGSKEEIYQALLNSSAAPDALQRVTGLFASEDFPNNLGAVGEAIFEVARDNRDYFKLLYIDVLEFQGKNSSHIIQAFRDGFHKVSESLLQHRIEAGQLIDDVHPAIMMRVMFDLFLYISLEEEMLGTSLAKDIGISQGELASKIARVVLEGVLKR